MHVTTQPVDKEESIVKMLTKVMSMKDKLEELSDEQKSFVNDLLQQLQAVFVGACITESISLFTHLMTSEILQSIHEMYESGQLTVIVRDLFRCLTKDDGLTVEVEIGADAFKECEDGFTDDGICMVTAVLCRLC